MAANNLLQLDKQSLPSRFAAPELIPERQIMYQTKVSSPECSPHKFRSRQTFVLVFTRAGFGC